MRKESTESPPLHWVASLYIYIYISPYSTVGNVRDNDIEINEFQLQFLYCVHLWTNTFGKGMNSLTTPAMSEIKPLLSHKNDFSLK